MYVGMHEDTSYTVFRVPRKSAAHSQHDIAYGYLTDLKRDDDLSSLKMFALFSQVQHYAGAMEETRERSITLVKMCLLSLIVDDDYAYCTCSCN